MALKIALLFRSKSLGGCPTRFCDCTLCWSLYRADARYTSLGNPFFERDFALRNTHFIHPSNPRSFMRRILKSLVIYRHFD